MSFQSFIDQIVVRMSSKMTVKNKIFLVDSLQGMITNNSFVLLEFCFLCFLARMNNLITRIYLSLLNSQDALFSHFLSEMIWPSLWIKQCSHGKYYFLSRPEKPPIVVLISNCCQYAGTNLEEERGQAILSQRKKGTVKEINVWHFRVDRPFHTMRLSPHLLTF